MNGKKLNANARDLYVLFYFFHSVCVWERRAKGPNHFRAFRYSINGRRRDVELKSDFASAANENELTMSEWCVRSVSEIMTSAVYGRTARKAKQEGADGGKNQMKSICRPLIHSIICYRQYLLSLFCAAATACAPPLRGAADERENNMYNPKK